MQPCLTVGVLVLQAEGLVSIIRYSSFLFQTTPAGVVAEPQQITVSVCHLARDTDLVGMEVVGLLSVFSVFGCSVSYLCQRFVAVGIGIEVVIPAVRVDFLQEVAAVVGFQAVVGDGRAIVIGQDIVCGVEGEHFITHLGNSAQFVVLEPGRARPLVGTVDQVAGAVVAVAAFDGISRCYCIFRCLGLRQVVECGNLFFQTA